MQAAPRTAHFLQGNAETAALIRDFDWSATALGSIESWPQSLVTTVGLLIHSPVPIVLLWGPDGHMIYNDAYSVFAGGRHPALLGCKVREGWPEVADFNDNVMKTGLSGRTLAYKNQELTLRRNGVPEQVWMNLDYSPVFDESGAPGGVIAIVVETTQTVLADRRRAVRVELTDQLNALTDPQAMPAVAAELVGRHLRVNRAGFCEVRPGRATVTCGTCFTDGVEPIAGTFRLADFNPANIARLRSGQAVVMADVRTADSALKADWEAAQARALVFVPLIREGTLRATFYAHHREPRLWSPQEVALIEDVAGRTWDAIERTRAEQQLREAKDTLESQVAERTAELQASRARLRTIFETSFSLQGLIALDGTMLDANATALEAIGCRLADVQGRKFWDSPWFSSTPGLGDHVREAVVRAGDGHVTRLEVLANLPVGGWRWFDFAIRPIYGQDGKVVAIVPEAVETTERRLAEEALRQAQKLEAMGQLTGGVAHDFNNLLTPILGSLDMLHRRGIGTEREQRLIEGGLQSAERAKTLVQRLLAFARKQPLQPQPVDAAAMVRGMRDLIASTSGPRIRVQLDIADDLPAATAEAGQLEMALLNLAVNARDAMAEGGVLTISVRAETLGARERPQLAPGTYVVIAVADTGIGMDEATLARAVEPFFSTKGIGRGTGLGLSMVHGLANQLHGTLTIASKPGLGTNVELWLPASATPAETQIPRPEAAATKQAGTVLLVDDEDLVRASTAAMLAELGYHVLQASSGEEALDVFERGGVNLLVTDHLMPGMTGTDLARTIQEQHPGLPVLVISGYAELDGIAAEYPRLAKPFRSADLAASLVFLATAAD